MLKRAENAIFARAINAIRPIEIKKICPERQKLYSNETITDLDKSPVLSSAHTDKPSDDVLQITVLNSVEERSVEIKSGGSGGNGGRQQRTKTPVRSIKDRLGKKLGEDVKSRSRTPPRKVVDNTRTERARSRSKERRSREQEKRVARDNRGDRKYRSPKSDNNRRSADARRNDSQKTTTTTTTTTDRSYRDRGERRRNSSESRDQKEVKEKKSARERNEKDGQAADLGRDEHKAQVEKATRDTERERELQKARVRARIREEERTKAQQGKVFKSKKA